MAGMDSSGPRAATVAIANHRLAATGTVRKSIEIARALRAAGISVELWVTEDGGDLRESAGDLPVIVAGGGSGSRAVVALARQVRLRRPRVFLSGGKHFHLRAGLALLLSGRRRSTRFVGRASNSLARPGKSRWALAVSRWVQGAKYAAMDQVIAISHALAAEIAGLPFVRSKRDLHITTIINGVDTGWVRCLAAEPACHRWIGDASLVVAVSVGRIDQQKGVDILLCAVARLPEHWRLILVGVGEPAYTASMVALAEKLGIADRVDFAGYSANPFPLVAAADLFVLASRWEGLPNAMLEALVLGAPVAASDCEAFRELLREGELGTLAPVGDDAALAAAMLAEHAMTRDPASRSKMLADATIERCMARYVAVLDPAAD